MSGGAGSAGAGAGMSLEQELLALEERFWVAEGRTDVLRERLAGDAVMIFPDPIGVVDEVAIIASLEERPPWTDVRIDQTDLVHLRDSAAVLTYRAEARDASGETSAVYAASVYVKADDEVWRLAFHQETPITH